MDRVAGISTDPKGIFHALSVRDAASLDREGQPIFAVRRLDAEAVEVLMRDGVWMLASPGDVSPPSRS
ncbi:MAG: hypothetical protein ACRDPH_03415 [Marmoricola sp.]